MRVTAIAALLCLYLLAPEQAVFAEAETTTVVVSEQTDWAAKRRRWLAEHCSGNQRDPRCRRYLRRRAAIRIEKVNVTVDCEADPYDDRCKKIERMEEQQLKLEIRSEIGAYCRENPSAPRCLKKENE